MLCRTWLLTCLIRDTMVTVSHSVMTKEIKAPRAPEISPPVIAERVVLMPE